MKNLGYRFIVIAVKRKCALNYLSSSNLRTLQL